jgi:hypothetical protein
MYKLNAKALEAVVRLWASGFETKDLFSAVVDLRAATKRLRHDHGYLTCCFMCKKEKPPLCIWVGNAAQLFEEIFRDGSLASFEVHCAPTPLCFWCVWGCHKAAGACIIG